MARRHLNAGTLTAPLPPVLATVGVGEMANIITIGWTGILSSQPPRTYISVRPERHSHKLLMERGEFVINLTTRDMAWAVDYAGIYTGAKVDKWEKCSLTKVESKEVAVPTIAESPLSLECKVYKVESMGTHDVFFADIVSVSADERILDEKGRLMLDRADLLAYAHGEYFALGEKLGRFGFSTDKGAKKAAQVNKSAQKDTKTHKNKKEGDKPFYLTAPRGKGGKRRK